MKGFPLIQAVPHPDRVAFMIDGEELVGYVFNPLGSRPFLFPVVGPADRYLTRIGHPHDPTGHNHHLSIWLGHQSVNGINFWEERSPDAGRQIHRRVVEIFDGGVVSFMTSQVEWVTAEGDLLMIESRTVGVEFLADTHEFFIDLDHEFKPTVDLTLGETPFGLLGVRVAKTMTVNDGGGAITNSEGMRDEKEIFWKRAKWCDYSGPVTPDEWNGLTLFDHPDNPDHPPHWHVRDDGWMCPSHFLKKGLELKAGESLKVRYRIFVHSGKADLDRFADLFEEFCEE
jgi:hypothetical protein